MTELKAKIRAADAILFVTPEYNYSIPGVLKNAIDWASRPYGDSAWNGKTVAVMGASVGVIGTARAQYHLRQVFVFLDMHAVNQPEVMINASKSFDEQGNLTDQQTKDLIGKLLANLIRKAAGRRHKAGNRSEELQRVGAYADQSTSPQITTGFPSVAFVAIENVTQCRNPVSEQYCRVAWTTSGSLRARRKKSRRDQSASLWAAMA